MVSLTLGSLIQIIALVGGMIAGYVSLQIRIKELEMKIMSINERMANVEKQDDKIMEKLDKIFEEINALKVQMQLKADKDV